MTSAAPRHTHAATWPLRVARDDDPQQGRRGKKPDDRPSHLGPIVAGMIGSFVLAVEVLLLIGEACDWYDLPPVVSMVMTACGVGGLIIASQVWIGVDAIHRIKVLVATVLRFIQDFADYRAERLTMVADARKEMSELAAQIAAMQVQAEADRRERNEAIAAACAVFGAAREEVAELRKILPDAFASVETAGYSKGIVDMAKGKPLAEVRTLTRNIGGPT